MEITEIELQNFRPYKGVVTFKPIVEDEKPLILVKGKNDTGKTSLFEAIRFCLFGVESREDWNPVINRESVQESDGVTKVTITFDHKGELFTIERGIEFSQVDDPDDRKADDWWREVRQPDGIVIERGTSEKEYSQFINRFMPDNVAQFFLFDAEQLERFEEEHDETVRDSIETVLGIQEIENAIDDLADRRKKFERELTDITSTVDEVNELREELGEILDEIDEIGDEKSGKISEKRSEISTKEAKLEDINNALQKAEGAEELREELEENKDEKKEAKKKLEEDLVPQRDELRREIGPLILQSAVDAFNENYQVEGAEGEASVINAILSRRDTCICGNELNEDERQHLQDRWNRLQGKDQRRLSQLKELGGGLNIDVETKLNHYQQLQREIRQTRLEVEEYDEEIEELEEDLNSIEQQYSDELKEQKVQLNEEISELEDEVTDLRERKGALKSDRDRIKSRIESMGGASEEEQRFNALIDLASDCKDAFEDIKDELVESRRESVEEATSETFMKLTNRPDYYKGIRITRNYELKVLTETAERSIAEQRPSAGQRQIIAYSFIAGLSKFTTRNAPVVIDTPIGRLDPEHKNNLVNFYHEFSDQVIILYQPNELSEEDIEIMADKVAKHFRIDIQDDGVSSEIEALPHAMSIPTGDD